ncbi:hypothetical protein E3P81_02942 [Wallemia ichthyophaga]|uniref:Protein PNS1 n=1 Tax=Wallemia ichthyophaga TaxID=245174 RepID=A0A4T0J8G3_WALIC|nr:hypothetical protein E3P97_02983 [Wallemia ichthyophaga]TIB30509.1 hypothetical protein E3P85_02677 [Wallemia ichthyophaga]TIB39056.1 hypothetical protein E3P86_01303 [Wallemia ichthyophaga]TIB48369.1 hypothetical protein E3P81_02942 [Wallemia ichthyophaga]TIB57561.1 hypothetical protein E3P79_02911 [Wallemia ichthyophaga]
MSDQWGQSYPPNNQQYHMQQPYYAPQQPPPPPPPPVDEKGSRFKPKLKLRDPIFFVFFLLTFFAFIGLSGYALYEWNQAGSIQSGFGNTTASSNVTFTKETGYLLLVDAAIGLVFAALYLLALRIFTKVILEVTLVLSIITTWALAIYQFTQHYWSGAIVLLIIGILQVVFYFGMRKRIPLASLLLKIVIDIAKHYPSVYVVSFIGLIIQTAWSILYAFAVAAVYVVWTPGSQVCGSGTGGSCSSGKVAGLVFFLTFAYLWVSQVFGNIVLVTLAGGPYGGWYYFGPYNQNGSGMPKHPTPSAFMRASTTSLGSIAFGSLIVTILEIIKMIFRALQNNADAAGEIGQILACCAVCVLNVIQWMIELFNKYAYISIALYGKSYLQSAKSTWHLFKDRGIDALVNDSLVSIGLTYGSYFVGVLCGLFTYVYLKTATVEWNSEGQYTAALLLYAFLIGFTCSMTLLCGIDAGVSTLFVGMAEDPHVLAQRAPPLFQEIRNVYPHVVEGVNV